ncbi:MAG: hypothetical protein ABSD75_27890 [Terriglobales bacterium]|jgi:photosystem II stability/assembly factor-like uncharacterized protein
MKSLIARNKILSTSFSCLLSALLLAVGPLPTQAQKIFVEEEGPEVIKARMDYFYKQRAYPLARIPHGARLHALDQLRRMQAVEGAKSQATTAWKEIGTHHIVPLPGDVAGGYPTAAGRMTAIAVDPNTPDTVYVGGAEGGVWKSTNGGAAWTPITDSQPSLAIGSIAIDPTNSQNIYVGTGEENFNGDGYYGAGILKSTDGGSSWALMGGGPGGTFSVCESGAGTLNSRFSGSYIGSIAVDPGNNQVVLATVDYCPASGVYRSADGGNTWTAVLAGNLNNIQAAGTSVFFVGGGVAYAALGETTGNAVNGVYMSSDDGQTWTAVNGTGAYVLPNGTNAGRIALTASAFNPKVLYAAVSLGDNFVGVYSTPDGAQHWYPTNAPDFCSKQCYYDIAIAASPTDSNTVYAGGIYNYPQSMQTTVIGSTDGGNTWTLVGASTGSSRNLLHTDVHALTFSANGKTLYVANDGGIWKTGDAATPKKLNWSGLNDTLATIQFYPGFVFDGQGNALGGTQDNGSLVLGAAPADWSAVTCGDGGFGAIDYTTSPYTFYTTCNYPGGVEISTTPSNPSTWTTINSGINFGDPALFIPPLVKDPSISGTLYYGTNQVYKTSNSGTLWASISPQPLPGSTGNVSAIAVAPSSSTTIYAGTTDSQIVATTNGGTTWTNVTTGLPPRYVSHIAVDPANSTTAYATYSGFSGFAQGDTLGHVFVTLNGGTTWSDISGNLPNIPVNDVVIDPVLANTLYAGTDLGVFVSSNGGVSWSTLGTALPNVAVLSLTLDPSARLLAAATHGRNAWQIDLPKK